jgi:hypothetical protein
MSKIVAVPDDLYNKAAEFAARDQVSIEEFISGAVANRLAGRDFLATRARHYSREEFELALKQIPDADPGEEDRL